jgi:uncharacterized protein DUF4349
MEETEAREGLPYSRLIMNKTHGLVVIALALSMAAGCAKAERAPAASMDGPVAAAPAAPAAGAKEASDEKPAVGAPAPAGRALVVTSELSLTTKNVRGTTERLRAEVERAGGYVSDASEKGIGDAKSAELEVRVPTNKTRALRAALADLGEITSDVEKVEDVTEARADLKARLQNARVEEKRIVDIMSQRTGTIAEVLSAEHELARVRENIERLEAQERSMEGKIALATVKIRISPPAAAAKTEPEAWKTPGQSIARAFTTGLRGAGALAVYGAMGLAAASPVLVPLGAVLTIVLAILRKRRRLAASCAPSARVVPGAG